MRVIIAGSRGINTYQVIEDAVSASGMVIRVVLSGTARGVDRLGEQWAENHGVPIKYYPADWRPGGVFDKAAGYKRNAIMAANAEGLIAVWDGISPGTGHMIDLAYKHHLQVYVHRVAHGKEATAGN